jgi:hypothetical protein
VSEEPDGAGGGALTARGDRCGVIEVAVDVDDVDVVCDGFLQGIGGSYDDAAVAADEEGNLSGLFQDGDELFAQEVPDDSGRGPVSDRGDRVMGQEAGYRQVSRVDGVATSAVESFDEICVAVGLGIVFGSGIE